MASAAAMLPLPENPYENKSWKVIVSTAVGFALATTGLFLRLLSRWLCHKRLEANDWLIIAAYPFKLGLDIASICLVEYGIGRHIQVIPLTDLRKYLQTLYVGSWVYSPCVGFIKLSILSLYWTAFPSKYIRYSVILVGSVVTAWAIASCLVGLLACLPIHKSWDPQVPGHCIDMNAYYYGLQIPNIVTDFLILFMPFKAIWNLKLGVAKSIQLSSVLAVGTVTCVFDIVRLVVLLRTPNTPDIPWNQVSASMWTDLEPSVAMLAACMPIMRPLLDPRQFFRSRSQAAGYDAGYGDSKGTDAMMSQGDYYGEQDMDHPGDAPYHK